MGSYGSGTYGAGLYGGGPSLALTTQDTYPTRVLCAATGLTADELVTIDRRPAGETVRTTVRGTGVEATSDALVKADAEAPFGVELTYTLVIGTTDVDTETVTLTLDGGKVALSDAISGAAAEVVILNWPSKQRQRESAVFSIGGRNVVVVGQRSGFSGTIEVFTETDEARDNVLNLLDTATAGIIQIRQPGPYTGVDSYVAVVSDNEQRFSQDGSDERRLIALDVVETRSWAPALESSTYTLQDIADTYPSPDTLADIALDFTTLLDIALGAFD